MKNMRDLSRLIGPVRYGFEPEDRSQEGALGVIMAERTKPGDLWAGRSRAIVRIARHRKRERDWSIVRLPINSSDHVTSGLDFEAIMLREILDLLPYSLKDEALVALVEGDGRVLRRVGREIREALPGVVRSES